MLWMARSLLRSANKAERVCFAAKSGKRVIGHLRGRARPAQFGEFFHSLEDLLFNLPDFVPWFHNCLSSSLIVKPTAPSLLVTVAGNRPAFELITLDHRVHRCGKGKRLVTITAHLKIYEPLKRSPINDYVRIVKIVHADKFRKQQHRTNLSNRTLLRFRSPVFVNSPLK